MVEKSDPIGARVAYTNALADLLTAEKAGDKTASDALNALACRLQTRYPLLLDNLEGFQSQFDGTGAELIIGQYSPPSKAERDAFSRFGDDLLDLHTAWSDMCGLAFPMP